MSEDRLQKMEDRLDESTSAMTDLTREISLLVQSNNHWQDLFKENKAVTEKNTDRIVALEKKSDIRDSKAVMYTWIERTVTVGVVAAILKGAGVI